MVQILQIAAGVLVWALSGMIVVMMLTRSEGTSLLLLLLLLAAVFDVRVDVANGRSGRTELGGISMVVMGGITVVTASSVLLLVLILNLGHARGRERSLSVLIIAEKQRCVAWRWCLKEVGMDLISSKHTLVGVQHDGTGGCLRRDGGWVGPEVGRKVDRTRRAGRRSGRVVAALGVVLNGSIAKDLMLHVVIFFVFLAAALASGDGAISIITSTGIRRRVVRADRIGPGDGQKGRGLERFRRLIFRRRGDISKECLSKRRVLDGPFHRCNAVGLPEDLVARKRPIVFATTHFAAAGG